MIFWSLYSLSAPLAAHIFACTDVHAPLYGFSAYVYVHPLMGFLAVSQTSEALWGFHVIDAIWDFQIGSQRWTPFEIWGSFAAFRPLRVCV